MTYLKYESISYIEMMSSKPSANLSRSIEAESLLSYVTP